VFYVASDERAQCIIIDMIDHPVALERPEA
jgi:hypothetical protein